MSKTVFACVIFVGVALGQSSSQSAATDQKSTSTNPQAKASNQQAGDKQDASAADETPAPDSDWLAVLGTGSMISGSDETDYEIINNNTIQATHVGRATPQLLTGLAFRLPFYNFKRNPTHTGIFAAERPWNVFVSLKFSPGTSNAVDGYVLGGAYQIGKYVDFLAGFSLTPFHEPSPGFQKIAAQVVANNPNVSVYKTFNQSDLLNNTPYAFDGFPILNQTGASGPIFSGNPLVVRYHGGFMIGIAFPISFQAKLGSAKPTDSQTTGSNSKAQKTKASSPSSQ